MVKEIFVLGFSEACMTMITDVLHTKEFYPEIKIINNLNVSATKEYLHPLFSISFAQELTGNYVIGGVRPLVRKKIKDSFGSLENLRALNLFSNNVNISKTVGFGDGLIINCGTTIAGHTFLDDFVFVNRNVSIGHHTQIGKFTTINPGANIAGNVKIGSCCQIGIGASIIDGITIGDNVIIGAGSVVTKNIESNVVAYGNPCKIVRENLK